MSKEWNPVAGLPEIEAHDIQTGDVIISKHQDGETYSRTVVVQPEFLRYSARTFYLFSREIKEPQGVGAIAEIYRVNPGPNQNEEVDIYIRVRPGHLDDSFGNDEAWTNSDNDVTYCWEDILKHVDDGYGQALRTFTATYKENK